MITLLSLSLALQLIFVVKIHQKNKKRLIKELIATVTFTKNGTNWWRVLTNKKDAEGGISSVSEMMVFLQSEIFAQSIPMAVLQVNAVLESSRIEPAVLISLAISLYFAAENVSYLTYIKDIDEISRK